MSVVNGVLVKCQFRGMAIGSSGQMSKLSHCLDSGQSERRCGQERHGPWGQLICCHCDQCNCGKCGQLVMVSVVSLAIVCVVSLAMVSVVSLAMVSVVSSAMVCGHFSHGHFGQCSQFNHGLWSF